MGLAGVLMRPVEKGCWRQRGRRGADGGRDGACRRADAAYAPPTVNARMPSPKSRTQTAPSLKSRTQTACSLQAPATLYGWTPQMHPDSSRCLFSSDTSTSRSR
jgi:hypothetical protein